MVHKGDETMHGSKKGCKFCKTYVFSSIQTIFLPSFILFFFFFSTLESQVLNYLKSHPHTEDIPSSLPGIDYIYMINLDVRPEKFEESAKRLAPYGIYPNRFSAVNGWELNFETIDSVGLKYENWMKENLQGIHLEQGPDKASVDEIYRNSVRPIPVNVPGKTYFAYGTSVGAIGIVLSHLSVLHDAYNRGYETIWVMEDDIKIFQDPNCLPQYINELDLLVGSEGWDILFTDLDTIGRDGKRVACFSYAERPDFTHKNPARFSKRVKLSPNFQKIGARYGAYSMIIRRSGMEKILQYFHEHKIFLPYDFEYNMPPDINLITVLEDIVSTEPRARSDNAHPWYTGILHPLYDQVPKDLLPEH